MKVHLHDRQFNHRYEEEGTEFITKQKHYSSSSNQISLRNLVRTNYQSQSQRVFFLLRRKRVGKGYYTSDL
jgi:hypothetical protein